MILDYKLSQGHKVKFPIEELSRKGGISGLIGKTEIRGLIAKVTTILTGTFL